MSQKTCAYCGALVDRHEKEHVIPRCLYPKSKSNSKVQRLTVPACSKCNRGWSDDEAHFRNVLLVSGDPNLVAEELWRTKARRSFEQIDGPRRVRDLLDQMRPVETMKGERYAIYPGEDERVMRIVRKVIRGLCHFHGIMSPVPDRRVWADVLRYQVPQQFMEEFEYHHREQDIFEYGYSVLDEPPIHSAWLLSFFEKRPFIGLVSTLENGFQDYDGG